MTEQFVSIDVEAGGPTPAHNLLSLGACAVADPDNGFYIELAPADAGCFVPEAVAVGGFTIEGLVRTGTPPGTAMAAFGGWLDQFARPRMVGFNACFDWQFVNDYCHRYLGHNPLGISALDIKALYMGHSGCEWRQTTKRSIPARFRSGRPHTHNALDDAREQAALFVAILDEVRRERAAREA